eukprot:1598154-Amphidinium_carterae.1
MRFYLGSAFVGYWMGHRRKLGNVLKTAQRQMKMNSCESRRVAGIHFGGVRDAFSKRLHRPAGSYGWTL